jgi:hypothetical protein
VSPGQGRGVDSFDPVRAIANAVLYEGYILWPYTRSALKNQQRFTFGGVHPPEHTRAHPDDRDYLHTEVLINATERTRIEISARFLQVVQRTVGRRRDGQLEPVDELEADGRRYLAWEEATEREVSTGPVKLRALIHGVDLPIRIRAGNREEEIQTAAGGNAGALRRGWDELSGELHGAARRVSADAVRVAVSVRNTTAFAGEDRAAALRRTFCSTHVLLRAQDGEFISLTDPPAALADAASACRNVGAWPVLVGPHGDRSTMLCSPIILEDHPQVAPESPGDLFDGGEIDQLLTLNILALTDEEKAEMAATDPRAREILERTQALTPEQLMALHGTVREVGLARR